MTFPVRLGFTPNGRQLLVSRHGDYRIAVCDATSGTERGRLHAPVNLTTFAVAPDGRTVAVAGDDGYLALWDLPDTGRNSAMKGKDEP
jgi:hypothetical protein